MEDWIPVISGLGGALIGAFAGYLGTRQAQKHSLAVARLARVQNREDQAVAALAALFGELQHHVSSVPDGLKPGLTNEARAASRAERELWDERLHERIAPARVAIVAIRDADVRSRLNESLELLEEWKGGLVYAFHNRSRRWVMGQLVSHAVDCIGAWQREEELPEPNEGFREARESTELWIEELEASIKSAEERESSAPGDRKLSSATE